MSLPWYAWAYLLLLALVAGGGVYATLRARRPLPVALLRAAAVLVFIAGVLAWYRGGAGTVFAVLLLLATLVHAQKAAADAREARARALPAHERIGTALGGLSVLPAIALGALAVWRQALG